MIKKIYSPYLEKKIPSGFSYPNKKRGFHHYSWNEENLLYMNDDTDDDYWDINLADKNYMKDFPNKAIIDTIEE